MDRGAHFHKCDFQVHTPRDLNWKGQGAVTIDERRQYAIEFVAACREKGLQAVAITDHHDLAFFDYIRQAAEIETDEAGKPLRSEQRLTVFPGMELTLGVPCQALVILDADFPTVLLPQVVQALSVAQTPNTDAHHNPTQRWSISRHFRISMTNSTSATFCEIASSSSHTSVRAAPSRYFGVASPRSTRACRA